MSLSDLQRVLSNINGINLNEESAFQRIRHIIEQVIHLPIVTYNILPLGTLLFRGREHKSEEGDFLNLKDLYAIEDLS